MTEQQIKQAIEDAMHCPVITRITRSIPLDKEGTEFDLNAFKRRTRDFAPEIREITREMSDGSEQSWPLFCHFTLLSIKFKGFCHPGLTNSKNLLNSGMFQKILPHKETQHGLRTELEPSR